MASPQDTAIPVPHCSSQPAAVQPTPFDSHSFLLPSPGQALERPFTRRKGMGDVIRNRSYLIDNFPRLRK